MDVLGIPIHGISSILAWMFLCSKRVWLVKPPSIAGGSSSSSDSMPDWYRVVRLDARGRPAVKLLQKSVTGKVILGV